MLPAAIVSAPVPLIAVPDTFKLFTAEPVSVPPLIVAPLTVPVHAKLPVAFVTVQPVLPEPPPIRISPVLMPPIPILLPPLASTVSAPVPLIAVPDTLSEFTADAVNVPPETVPPLKVPPLSVPPEMVAPLMVLAAVTAPADETLNLLVGDEPDCKSSKLPLGEALVFEAKITAWPEVGLPLVVTDRVELVFVPLLSRRTPDATPLLELVKVYKLLVAVTANVEVSIASFANDPADTQPAEVQTALPPIVSVVDDNEVFEPTVNVPEQANAPVLLVSVQPVAPLPPPKSILPVLVFPMLMVPVVAASSVRF